MLHPAIEARREELRRAQLTFYGTRRFIQDGCPHPIVEQGLCVRCEKVIP